MKNFLFLTRIILMLIVLSSNVLASNAFADSPWNGLWMHADPDNRTGFRKFETDYMLIEGDRAKLTRTVGQHVSVHEETFFVKGPTTCELGRVEMLCVVSEDKLKLCNDAWHCSDFTKTTKSIPSAPSAIEERPSNLRFAVTYQIGADTVTQEFPISDILPSDTSYPLPPVKIPLFLHDIASAEAWVQVYWISGKSSSLSAYQVEIQIMQLNGSTGVSKLATMSGPQRMSSFFNTKLKGIFITVPFEVHFRVR